MTLDDHVVLSCCFGGYVVTLDGEPHVVSDLDHALRLIHAHVLAYDEVEKADVEAEMKRTIRRPPKR